MTAKKPVSFLIPLCYPYAISLALCQRGSVHSFPRYMGGPHNEIRYRVVLFLLVSVPPSIDPSDQYVAATENKRTLLLCETEGLPAPSVTWTKDGERITPRANPR